MNAVWLNVAQGRAVHAVDSGSKSVYALCTDDATLIAAGLEPFSESFQRYLGVGAEPEQVIADVPFRETRFD